MKVESGILDTPFKIVFVGPEGCGKTTLVNGAPEPVFFDPNGRTSQVNCNRVQGRSWQDLMQFVADASNSEYQTIIIDEMSTIEHFCWEYVCKRDGKDNIEKYGYGKGYVVAMEEFKRLLHQLERSGKNIILVGHTQVVNFKNPEGSDYNRFEIAMHKHAAGYIMKWSDAVLFYRYETFAHKDESGKVVGQQTGARIIHTRHRAAYDAKNSYDMPPDIEVPEGAGEAAWQLLDRYIRPGKPEEIISQIEAVLPKLNKKQQEEATKFVNAAGDDARKLVATLNWMEKKAS